MLSEQAQAWLDEDAADEDLTSASVIPEGASGRAEVHAKEPFVVAGLEAATSVLGTEHVAVETGVDDGDRVDAGDVLLTADGDAHDLLARERVTLNLIGHLSGIATRTAEIVDAVAGTSCEVLATRKTTPGLRELEHAAVVAGGARPHRADLSEAILVQENHLTFVTIPEAVEAAGKNAPEAFCMVEAETLDDARAVARAGADGVLLDNVGVEQLADTAELVRRIQPGIVVEASGGITRETVAAYAEHVDRVSLGSITHSAPSVDVSMRVEPVS